MVRFDPELSRESVFHLDEHPAQGMAPGPCGMGPTGGETIHSMHVWVFQNVVGGVALASVGDGDHTEVREWSQAVTIVPESQFPGRTPPPPN
jgi:hypothetical protein